MNPHAKTSKLAALAALLALGALPLSAWAHAGHAGDGFAAGFVHPFLGLDHLLAMLAVGVLGVLQMRRAWPAPLGFVVMLAGGALAGQPGLQLPHLEPLVAASVIVLGTLLASRARLGGATVLGIVGAFGFCHGLAHGSELDAGATVLAGIVLGSAALHAAGMLLAQRVLARRAMLAQRVGQLFALCGAGLLASTLF